MFFLRNCTFTLNLNLMQGIEEIKLLLSVPKNVVVTAHRNPVDNLVGVTNTAFLSTTIESLCSSKLDLIQSSLNLIAEDW